MAMKPDINFGLIIGLGQTFLTKERESEREQKTGFNRRL